MTEIIIPNKKPLLAKSHINYDHADHIEISVELPGFDKKDINVKTSDNEVSVTATSEWVDDRAVKFELSPWLNSESITAELRNGILLLKVDRINKIRDIPIS